MTGFEDDIAKCIQVLQQGGTIVYPTDTIWGIGCDALDEQAVEKVFELKNRPREKSLIVLLADARDVLQYVAAPHPDIIDIIEQFERPTTVIYENALGFPENVTAADGSIAIRITTDPFCKALIKRFRRPIISTSANKSGMPSAPTFPDIDNDIVNSAGYTVQHRRDDTGVKPASRLVRIMDDGSLEILRG
jgi:Putative translation factor (SUA5)